MQQINEGDYILGKDIIWEIIKVYKSGVDTVYDIKNIGQPTEFLEIFDQVEETWEKSPVSNTMVGVSRGYIRHLGDLVPKDSEKAIKTLF